MAILVVIVIAGPRTALWPTTLRVVRNDPVVSGAPDLDPGASSNLLVAEGADEPIQTDTLAPTVTDTATETATESPTATEPATGTPVRTDIPTVTAMDTPAPTATSTPLPDGSNISLPARGMFYYPWFAESWTQQDGIFPWTRYEPTLGYYDSGDAAVVGSHVADMIYAGVDVAIASWWGADHWTDGNVPVLLSEAQGTSLKVAFYYEEEGFGNPNRATLIRDLEYINTQYGGSSTYAKLNGRLVVYVYNADDTTCTVVDRWKAANTINAYLVMKVFPGYSACANQPDAWHQYGPSSRAHNFSPDSYNISPGFWRIDEAQPRSNRDPVAFAQNVRAMIASGAEWQLVTSFNEWGEGSGVEGTVELGRVYLDILATDGQGGIPGTSTPAPQPTATQSPSPAATNTDAATSTATHTDTPASTVAGTETPQLTATPIQSATATETPTDSPEPTETPTSTGTPPDSPTGTAIPTETPTTTATETAPSSKTPTDTATLTSIATPTPTATPLSTPSSIATAPLMPTAAPTNTPTETAIPTATPSNTLLPTASPTPTYTATSTPLPTATPSATTAAPSGPVVFTPVADARVEQARPTTNFGSATTLIADTSPRTETYLRFTVTGLNGSAQSAKLRLWVLDGTSNGPPVSSCASTTWSEIGITWNTKPATSGARDDKGSIARGRWVEYDVTPFVVGNGVVCLALVPQSSDRFDLSSKEGGNPPQLVIVSSLAAGTATTTPTRTPTSTPAGVPISTTAPTATNVAGNLVFVSDADSRVDEARPTTNYGTSTELRVDAGTGADIESFLRFTVSGVSGTLTRATLRVYVMSGSVDGPDAQLTGTQWTETGITWTTRPARISPVLADVGNVLSGTSIGLDVTSVVAGNGVYSFVLATGSTDGTNLASRQNPTNNPQLVISHG